MVTQSSHPPSASHLVLVAVREPCHLHHHAGAPLQLGEADAHVLALKRLVDGATVLELLKGLGGGEGDWDEVGDGGRVGEEAKGWVWQKGGDPLGSGGELLKGLGRRGGGG